MSLSQFIYLQEVSHQKLQVAIETALDISLIPSEKPDWLFHYENNNIGDISVGWMQSLTPDYFISCCSKPIRPILKILFHSTTNNTKATDVAVVKCVNSILHAFDTDLLFMFEDGTHRLVRCQGKVFVNWNGKPEGNTFWDRPGSRLIDYLTVPYGYTKSGYIDYK